MQPFNSRPKTMNSILTSFSFVPEISLPEFSVFTIIISLCHDNVSFTISRNFFKKENKREEKKLLPTNLIQLKHWWAELWDEFQVLFRFTESRKWGIFTQALLLWKVAPQKATLLLIWQKNCRSLAVVF